MTSAWLYQSLADTVLAIHFAVVLFVIGGLAAIIVGNLIGRWPWVNRPWLRIAHLAAIGIVVAESWLGVTCPLTVLESWLRAQAGLAAYDTSFIQYWLHRLLFYQAPAWVFATAYTAFGLLVLAAWCYFPPAFSGRGRTKPEDQ